jgi:hypothetical protein
MIVNDQISEFEQIYNSKIEGVPVTRQCEKCHVEFVLDSQIKIYKCCHAYHHECIAKREDYQFERC